MRRNTAILIFDDVEVLDFAGPFEVFSLADALRGHAAFHAFTFAETPGLAPGSSVGERAAFNIRCRSLFARAAAVGFPGNHT